ncbi:histamine H2 receptor-like [Orbicella faveolata]|uniref:histamine H2 receptor-like n=2 Tax=Orbicella faveolata TaxID=48498 RepID=UPI0009E26B41|nr:histamine H2 receptor-like [Orbicella faveolata]
MTSKLQLQGPNRTDTYTFESYSISTRLIYNMNRSSDIQPNCFFLSVNLERTHNTVVASILTSILNVLFSLLTSTGNVIILRVIWKKQELHSPSFVLLSGLAASDLIVGLVCQPSFVAYHIAELTDDFDAYCALRIIQSISSYTTIGVSLATLSGISIDRLLALTLHLRYNGLVTIRKIMLTAVVVWVVSTSVVLLRFWISNWFFVPVAVLLITFLITALSTWKIFQIVRRHQRQISQQQRIAQRRDVNVLKSRKSTITVLYVYGLLLLFFFPLFVTIFVESFTGYTTRMKIVYDYVTTAVFINSFLNPLVYCWRIGEIRRAVRNALRKNNNEVTILESTFRSVSKI